MEDWKDLEKPRRNGNNSSNSGNWALIYAIVWIGEIIWRLGERYISLKRMEVEHLREDK